MYSKNYVFFTGILHTDHNWTCWLRAHTYPLIAHYDHAELINYLNSTEKIKQKHFLIYLLSSRYHSKSASGTASASHLKTPLWPRVTPTSLPSNTVGGSIHTYTHVCEKWQFNNNLCNKSFQIYYNGSFNPCNLLWIIYQWMPHQVRPSIVIYCISIISTINNIYGNRFINLHSHTWGTS